MAADLAVLMSSGVRESPQPLAWCVMAPVLMFMARDSVENRIASLNTDADDYYVTKPFVFDELLARINAPTRRRSIRPHAWCGAVRSRSN